MKSSVVINILCLSVCLLSHTSEQSSLSDESVNGRRKSAIVFGGNGFIGASTVERLVREEYYVVIINRGTWYWDSERRVKPHVTHIQCDRTDMLQNCRQLQHFIWSETTPIYFDVLIDFSGYDVFQITDALRILEGKILKYIYISSDSVYEVANKTHAGRSMEEDSVRPDSREERERLKQKDNYGHRKLECEEELVRQSLEKEGVPFTILRLPDVVGPRDNTYRWWLYQLWVKLHGYLDRKLSVPSKFWNEPISFVYVDDVADAILNCIQYGSELNNEVFNLAQDETPTLIQYLHALMDALDMDDIDILEDTNEEAFHLFPSVTSGPLDTQKSKARLNWKATPWHDVVHITVKFYEEAIRSAEFEKERKDVIRTLQQHFSTDPIAVLRGLQNKYELDFGLKHDEL